MSKTYYKVVKKANLSSAWAPGSVRVYYKVGQFVGARYPELPLAVFETFEYAREFKNQIDDRSPELAIFECEIQGKYRKAWVPSRTCTYPFSRITKLIRQIKAHKKYLDMVSTQLPQGSVVCKKIKLTKEVPCLL
jgi:hypothetical protein